jgi:hypothetical protein
LIHMLMMNKTPLVRQTSPWPDAVASTIQLFSTSTSIIFHLQFKNSLCILVLDCWCHCHFGAPEFLAPSVHSNRSAASSTMFVRCWPKLLYLKVNSS